MSSVLHVVSRNDDLDHDLAPIVQASVERGVDVMGVAGPEVDPAAWSDLGRVSMTWIDAPTQATARSLRRDVTTLARLLARHSPTVVHIHAGPLAAAAQLAIFRTGIGRCVYSTARFDQPNAGSRASRTAGLLIERLVASRSDAVHVSSVPAEDRVVHTMRVPQARVAMVGTGVDLVRFAPNPSATPQRAARRARLGLGADDFVCGIVGEDWAGDLGAAIGAARGDEKDPHVRCIELEQSHLGSAAARAEFFDAVDVVVFGTRTGVAPAIGPSDAALAQEAAASAKVAIVGERAGIRLVVEDARTGYVMAVADVGLAARRIAELLADPPRRARMADAARAKAVREFDRNRVVDAIFESYHLGRESDAPPVASRPRVPGVAGEPRRRR